MVNSYKPLWSMAILLHGAITFIFVHVLRYYQYEIGHWLCQLHQNLQHMLAAVWCFFSALIIFFSDRCNKVAPILANIFRTNWGNTPTRIRSKGMVDVLTTVFRCYFLTNAQTLIVGTISFRTYWSQDYWHFDSRTNVLGPGVVCWMGRRTI